MSKLYSYILLVFALCIGRCVAYSVTARPGKVSKTSCTVFLGGESEDIRKLGKVIAFDLDFSGQFKVSVRRAREESFDKSFYKSLFEKGTDLCVYIKPLANKSVGMGMVGVEAVQTWVGKKAFDKTVSYDLDKIVKHGHAIGENLLESLTGKKGACASTLSWCEGNEVYYSDYACMQPRKLVSSPGNKFALSYHSKAPMIFFTQTTEKNHELCSVSLKNGRERVHFSYPGLTMQFACSRDGSSGVTCMSGSRGNTELYLYNQSVCNKLGRQAFTQLTNNGGTNVSPCYLPNGDIVFCSDFQTGCAGRPQIYYMDVKTKKAVRLTDGRSYCAAPSYCAATQSVVYNKPVKRVFQLFSLNLKGFDVNKFKEGRGLAIEQLTFGLGNKTEPCWHPGGEFVAFVQESKPGFVGAKSFQIAILNLIDSSVRVVTRGSIMRGFPAWTDRSLY